MFEFVVRLPALGGDYVVIGVRVLVVVNFASSRCCVIVNACVLTDCRIKSCVDTTLFENKAWAN